MLNSIVCKECHGSINVAYRHEVEPIDDTGLQKWTLIPQGPADESLLAKVMPEVPPAGYRLVYTVEVIDWQGKEKKVRKIFMERDPDYKPGNAPSLEVKLTALKQTELVELAVRKGITAADMTWTKARLIGEIEKVGK